jgi:WD40 repeat protein
MAKSEKDLSSIALLSNGNIISASNDKALKLWNINDNNCIFLATEQVISSLLMLPDDKFACCSYQYNHINIWKMKADSDPECIKSINTYEGCKFINKLFLLSDLNIACSARFDESFRILILDSKNEYNCIQNFLGHIQMINDLVSLPYNRIASGSNDETIKIWDLDKGNCIKALTGHKHWITSLIFIERDNSLISGSHDGSIKIWEVNDFHCLKTIQIKNGIRNLLLLPGGYFASSGYNSVKIWDIKNCECINSLENQKGSVGHLVLTEDRRIVSVFNHDTLVVWKF